MTDEEPVSPSAEEAVEMLPSPEELFDIDHD